MTTKLFLVTLLCIFLVEISSSSLLQNAKRVCQRAAHNWRLINPPPRKMFTRNIPMVERKIPNQKIPYLKFRTELFPVGVKYFGDREENVAIEIDDTEIMQSNNDKFKLLHKMNKSVDIVANDHVSDRIEFSCDFEEFDDILNAIDLFEIPTRKCSLMRE